MNKLRNLKLLWAIALCMGLSLAGDARAAELKDSFRFIDPVQRPPGKNSKLPKTQIVVQKKWPEAQKQRVIAAIKKLNVSHPDLSKERPFLARSSYAEVPSPRARARSPVRSVSPAR